MNEPRKILVVSLSNIGDVILTTPVIASLAERFPVARLSVAAGPKAKGLLESSRLIDRLILYDKNAGWGHRWRFFREMRRESYDWVVDLRNSAIPLLVKTKKRSSFIRLFQSVSMRERHLEVLRWMGVLEDAEARFDFFHDEDSASVRQKLAAAGIENKRYILAAPAAASELKTWRLEGFRKVLAGLLEKTESAIVLVGDEREKSLIDSLTALDPARVVNFAGGTSLRELAVLVKEAQLLLTNDSAAMHLASELKRPVVAVFGPTSPAKYRPIGLKSRVVREPVACSPCERSTCRFSRQACFEDLRPQKVLEACLQLLRQRTVISAHDSLA